MSKKLIWRGSVTGLSFHNYGRHATDIEVGQSLFIHPIQNDHDPFAIGVLYKGEQIGWIPKALNQGLHKFITESRHPVEVRVTNHDRSQPFDRRLFINVFGEDGIPVSDYDPLYKAPINSASASNINQSTSEKSTMNTKKIVDQNKQAATGAAYAEAGRLANKKAKEVLSKKAPMMVRGYVDTPIGGIVISNLAILAVEHFRPDDQRLVRLTRAMQVQAYAELIQSFDIESFIDDLLENPTMKRALSKLEADDEAGEG